MTNLTFLERLHFTFLKTYFSTEELLQISEGDLKNCKYKSGKLIPLDVYEQDVRKLFSPTKPTDFCFAESKEDDMSWYITRMHTHHSRRAVAAKFFGWPWVGGLAPKDEKIRTRIGKFVWFAITLTPRLLLNAAKLVTEVLPSTLVGLTSSSIDKFKKFKKDSTIPLIQSFKVRSPKKALAAIFATLGLGLLYLVHVPALLTYFAGRAITSPMRNARESWQMFSSWRKKASRLKKAAGYIFGGAAFLLSTAITATAYFFLWPYALVAGKAVGIGALAAKIAAISKWGIGSWISAKAAIVSQFMSQTILANMSLGMTAAGNFLAAQAAFQPLAAAFYFVAQQPLALFVAATMSSTPIVGNILRPVLRATGAKLRVIAEWIAKKIDDTIDGIVEANRTPSKQPLFLEEENKPMLAPVKVKGGSCVDLLRKMCGCCIPSGVGRYNAEPEIMPAPGKGPGKVSSQPVKVPESEIAETQEIHTGETPDSSPSV